jgi:OOP family OmpA-OmpF porin
MPLLFALLLPLTSVALQDAHEIYSIYFGGGSYYIDPQQEQGLYKFLDAHPQAKNLTITIHSHTDDIGSLEYNERLSRMRSLEARKRLLHYGIPAENLSIQDFGELNPVYDNSTWEGKLKNRRVDIIIHRMEI